MQPFSNHNGDFHAVSSSITQLKNALNKAVFHGIAGSNYGASLAGGGSTVNDIKNVCGDVCLALDNFTSQLNVTTKTLDRFIDTVEGLGFPERPVVFVEEETADRAAGVAREESD